MKRLVVRALGAVVAAWSMNLDAVAAVSELNLTSYANGAWIVKKPAEYGSGWSGLHLLDERGDSGWASPRGSLGPHEMVIALPERSVIKVLEFDTAGTDGDAAGSRAAKDVVVAVSDRGPTSGWRVVASATLKPRADRQRVAVSRQLPGRWVRLTVKNNHGSAEYVELMDFRALGEQKTRGPAPNLSGTYVTNYGNFHLQQNQAAVTGCYEFSEGVIANGGIEGRVVRFTWVQGPQRGPAVLTFSPDGQEMLGLWWNEGSTDRPGQPWSGQKISDAVGGCPHWSAEAAPAIQLANDLAQGGRARLYGIHFDTDSDTIKPESKAALDVVVRLAKDQPDWTFTIEGHTDATASATHNQTLSEQRAAAVKAHLVAAGVAAPRLNTRGLGASQPLARNDTAIGRAQNRRVELVRN